MFFFLISLELLKYGVAFHHAGLTQNDKVAVEIGFKNQSIKYLCSTSTLAIGITLPARLVIIRSTRHYGNNKFEEYSALEIIQMMGRAGRPQVIICFVPLY